MSYSPLLPPRSTLSSDDYIGSVALSLVETVEGDENPQEEGVEMRKTRKTPWMRARARNTARCGG